jgi:hypothetical protein
LVYVISVITIIFSFHSFSYSSIKFDGNTHTSSEYLYQLLFIEKDQHYTKEELIEKIPILYDTGLFYSISHEIQNNEFTYILTYKNSTNYYVNYSNSSNINRLSFGVQERNAFDRLILIGSYFENQDSKWSQTYWFEYPQILPSIDLLFTYYNHNYNEYFYANETENIEIKRYGFKPGLRYHLNERLTIQADYEYFDETYYFDQTFSLNALNGATLEFEKNSYQFHVQYRKLNSVFYTINGYNILNQFKYFENSGYPSYYINTFSARYYYSSNRQTIANRIIYGISDESQFLYPFGTDGFTTIRSSKFNEKRGQSAIILNNEYRFTFYDTNQFYFQSVVFSDYANLWNDKTNMFNRLMPKHNEIWAIGIGLRAELKTFYNSIVRLDFPYRDGKFELLFGVGQFF